MKTDFSTEIQMNLTDPVIMGQNEQANAVLNQTKKQEESQQQHMEVAVSQTQKKSKL